MKKILLGLTTLLVLNINTKAQFFSDFEDLSLPLDSFENGKHLNGSFVSGYLQFMNQYTDWGGGFESSNGFSYSTMRDSITAGYTNAYSSRAATGYNSNTYAVFYDSYVATAIKPSSSSSFQPLGFYLNNNTYAYMAMRDGDSFSKKFGGSTGDDPDYFYVNIYNFQNGAIADTITFYLADYRFSNNSQDYIVKDWTYVDLTSFGSTDSIAFGFASSDTGSWGINTPLYFCMDKFSYDLPTSVNSTGGKNTFSLHPNPASDKIYFNINANRYSIYDVSGKVVANENILNSKSIDISNLNTGIYLIELFDNNERHTHKFIKE